MGKLPLNYSGHSLYRRGIPIDIKARLCRVLEQECKLHARMKCLAYELMEYMSHQLFNLVSYADYITEKDIEAFMRGSGYYVTYSDIINIVNRLDKDRDGRVSYLDFMSSLLMFKPLRSDFYERTMSPQMRAIRSEYPSYTRSFSAERTPITKKETSVQTEGKEEAVEIENKKMKYEAKEEYKEFSFKPKNEDIEIKPNMTDELAIFGAKRPLKGPPSDHETKEELKKPEDEEIKESRARRPKKEEKETLEIVDEQKTNEELKALLVDTEPIIEYHEPKQDSFTTPIKTTIASPEHPTTGVTPARVQADPLIIQKQSEFLLNFFKDQVEVDKLSERVREEVCVKGYGVKDFLRFFTGGLRETVSLLELREGLERQGVYRCYEELMITMKRYDLNRDGMLDNEEFEDMILPRDERYKEMLNKDNTNEIPKDLMRSLIDNEVQIELLRRDLDTYLKIYNCSLEDTFNILSQAQKGYITPLDVIFIITEIDERNDAGTKY